jgi:hypothetical protein
VPEHGEDPRDERSAFEPTPGQRQDRWLAGLALLLGVALNIALPHQLSFVPDWTLPALEVVLIGTLAIHHSRWFPVNFTGGVTRGLQVTAIALVTVANLTSLGLLLDGLLEGDTLDGRQLVLSALAIWGTNVIAFGLWFWELDGGPLRPPPNPPNFQFPQQANPNTDPGWSPRFFDYLYVSFTNSTAFSPTDAMPLRRPAKALMMVQASAALVTVAVLAARAINILGSN